MTRRKQRRERVRRNRMLRSLRLGDRISYAFSTLRLSSLDAHKHIMRSLFLLPLHDAGCDCGKCEPVTIEGVKLDAAAWGPAYQGRCTL
jgi:hypothetical protein